MNLSIPKNPKSSFEPMVVQKK
nr:hypothetical protein [Ilyobacter polytropus]